MYLILFRFPYSKLHSLNFRYVAVVCRYQYYLGVSNKNFATLTSPISPLNNALRTNYIRWQLEFVFERILFLGIFRDVKFGFVIAIHQIQWMFVHAGISFKDCFVIGRTKLEFEPTPMISGQFHFHLDDLALHIDFRNSSSSVAASVFIFSWASFAPIIAANATLAIIFFKLD